jgi:uncharacterized protein YjiS (DUF1127 family)
VAWCGSNASRGISGGFADRRSDDPFLLRLKEHAMTALSLKPAIPSGLQAILRVGKAALRRMKLAGEVLRRRREAAALAGFNDHMLADIGLTRGDLNDAFAQPPWRDPTTLLVARVKERRTSRRRAAWPPRPRRIARAPSLSPADERPHEQLAQHPPATLRRADAA